MATLNIMTWNIENLGLSKLNKNGNIGSQITGIAAHNKIDILFLQETQKGNLGAKLDHAYDAGTTDPLSEAICHQLNLIEGQKQSNRKWHYQRSDLLNGYLSLPQSFALSFTFQKKQVKKSPPTLLKVSKVVYVKPLTKVARTYNDANNKQKRKRGIAGHTMAKQLIRKILNVKGVEVDTGSKQDTFDGEQQEYRQLWTPERQGLGAGLEKFVHKFYYFFVFFPDGYPNDSQVPASGLTFHCYYHRKQTPTTDTKFLPPEGYLSKKPIKLVGDNSPEKSQDQLDREHLIEMLQKQSIIRKNTETYTVLYRASKVTNQPFLQCDDVEVAVGYMARLTRINNGRPPAQLVLNYKDKSIPIIMLHMLFGKGKQSRIREDMLKLFEVLYQARYNSDTDEIEAIVIRNLDGGIVLGDLNFAANDPENASTFAKIKEYGYKQATPLPNQHPKGSYTSLNQLGRYQTNNKQIDRNKLPLSTLEYRSNAYDHIFYKGITLAQGKVIDPISDIFLAIAWKNIVHCTENYHITPFSSWNLKPDVVKERMRAILPTMHIPVPQFMSTPGNPQYQQGTYTTVLANNDPDISYYISLGNNIPWGNAYNVVANLTSNNQNISNKVSLTLAEGEMLCKEIYYYAFEIYRKLISDHLPVLAQFTI